jgi:hypothetical protein
MLPVLLLTLGAVLAAPAPTISQPAPARWGRIAHRAIALVAEERLSRGARRTVDRLLDGATLAEVSTWADSIRPERPETAPWHYVNVPVIDSVYRPARHCPRQCVIRAYQQQLAILADRRRPSGERAEALRWVVHLLEDLHQPLHVGDRGDRGGNDVALTLEGRRTNLHALWDSGIIEALGYTEATLAAELRTAARQRRDLRHLTGGSVIDWAMESHQVSRDLVYHALPQSLALDRGYLDLVRPALHLQLLRASVRLASVLDRALGKG